MPHQYKHKEWERYFPIIPVVTWIKAQNLRKFKLWAYTGLAWTVLLGTTTIYLTDWNPIKKILPSKKETEPNTDNIDPSNNSLYQKVAYGCGFYKFIRPSCKVKGQDNESKKKEIEESPPDNVENMVKSTEVIAMEIRATEDIGSEISGSEVPSKKKSSFFRTENETNIDQLKITDTKIPPNMVSKDLKESDVSTNEDNSTDNKLLDVRHE